MEAKPTTEDKITVRAIWSTEEPEQIECFRVSLSQTALSTRSIDGGERVIPYKDCQKIQIYPTDATIVPVKSVCEEVLPDEIEVNVRWHDGMLEPFICSEVRFGSDLLWMRLMNGQNRHIPLRSVRWFSVTPESHENITQEE